MKPLSQREIEYALAAEAAAHAYAALELNPFGEAESFELGDARAVSSGAISPVHGVFGLGLEGEVEERDLRDVERFFLRKERAPAFWVASEAHPSLLELLKRDYQPTRKIPVHGLALASATDSGTTSFGLPEPVGSSTPDLGSWTLAFTQALDPQAKEPGLLALTKLHQKESRFYLSPHSASYTFFSKGLALVLFPPAHSLLALQAKEAADFRASALIVCGNCPLPFLYERTLYEQI